MGRVADFYSVGCEFESRLAHEGISMGKMSDKIRERLASRTAAEREASRAVVPHKVIYLNAPSKREDLPSIFDQIVSPPRRTLPLAKVFENGRVEFFSYDNGKQSVIPSNWPDAYLVETIQEIGQLISEGQLDHVDGGILLDYLNLEIARRVK